MVGILSIIFLSPMLYISNFQKKEVVNASLSSGKKDAKVEERKREEEPFGIKHVLIALGCVALMAAFIHLLAYILIVIVLMIVLAVGAQVLFVAASANTTPAALKKELERAKASGEVSGWQFNNCPENWPQNCPDVSFKITTCI